LSTHALEKCFENPDFIFCSSFQNLRLGGVKLDLVILAFACYTVDAYRRQIETINDTWGGYVPNTQVSVSFTF
jgi:hypothetical protein